MAALIRIWQHSCIRWHYNQNIIMLINYLKIAWRNLRKDSFYTVINVLGLALATAAFLFLIDFVQFEYSYEDFHPKAKDIYRVTMDRYKDGEYVVTDCETNFPLAAIMKKRLPEVMETVRLQTMEEFSTVNYGNQSYIVDKVYAADPTVFTMFNFPFVEGVSAHALDAPMQVVLTASLARRLFGDSPAKGKTIKALQLLLTVTGVIKDVPPNTHLKFDMLVSFPTLSSMGWKMDNWQGNNNFTYVQLAPGADLAVVNRKLLPISKEFIQNNRFTAEPIKDIHLYSHKTFEPEINGDAKSVRFMLMIAVLVLLIGSVNYVNLSTARASNRVKEIGMRRVLGSSRSLLIRQLMVETILVNLLAMCLALMIVQLLTPAYVQLIGKPIVLQLFSSRTFWGICAAIFVFNCLLSGLYPAISLSGTKAITVMQRTSTGTSQGNLLRRMLVVGQFAAALLVLSASLIVYRQLSFMRGQDLGLNPSQVLVVKNAITGMPDSTVNLQNKTLRESLSRLPHVTQVAMSGSLPGVSLHELATMSGISRYGSKSNEGLTFYLYGIDAHFIPNMQMKMAAGDNFREGYPYENQVIISRQAAKILGFASPEAAVGQKLSLQISKLDHTVITGVVDDYHQRSLKESILPMIHWYYNGGAYYTIRVDTKDVQQTITAVKQVWDAQYPGYPFEYHFMDELFDQQYKSDQQFGQIVKVFSLFTLFITCLGILGLTAYNVTRRTKEIGIRKVLGASSASIVRLLSQDMVRLVLIAIVVGTPLSWYMMSQWLEDFAYHIEIQWWMFVLAGLMTVLIALLTVSFQSVRAALTNPVRSLRSE
ncbi:ABC transporter permease [Chitinophaga pendula]|uniref:ABC transporter permease n=1 Tax=Chitinophaga TaxID=79328 RepID=UPI000BAF1C9C|nr:MULTISPECIES: ABC transporter permease [Chitinophaga]ASZ13427.1 hypothetical protein CK934_21925 [Chitinophaga sp. MD30]UCJ08947.1 ABC transporter permease [Chitinophaga pendula]